MKFIVFVFILIKINTVSAQVGVQLKTMPTPPQLKPSFLIKNENKTLKNTQNIPQPSPTPLVFSVESLPFFCKIEYKMGLNKKMPVKFRLGDVPYVDGLEGKGFEKH